MNFKVLSIFYPIISLSLFLIPILSCVFSFSQFEIYLLYIYIYIHENRWESNLSSFDLNILKLVIRIFHKSKYIPSKYSNTHILKVFQNILSLTSKLNRWDASFDLSLLLINLRKNSYPPNPYLPNPHALFKLVRISKFRHCVVAQIAICNWESVTTTCK